MKLLIATQIVDTDDPVLGFFIRWIEEFAKHYERIEVICLKEGTYTLPENVHVHSLGKERGAANRVVYAWRFLSLTWKLRKEYNAVFVHMNQEYVLIAGGLWKVLGKRIYLWRNHYAGSWLTDVTAVFCTKIFCTSTHSYTARYKKTTPMPVGVDTERFFPDARIPRTPHSILFLARMAPSKRPELLIAALTSLAQSHTEFTADLYGSPLTQDLHYYEELKEKVRIQGLERRITFYPGPRNDQAPDIYRAHEIFVNCSPSGMLDKTIFEAAACGCVVLAASDDWKEIAGENYFFTDVSSLAARIHAGSVSGNDSELRNKIVASQSLAVLASRLASKLH